jgi:protein associated with RNAse G/E
LTPDSVIGVKYEWGGIYFRSQVEIRIAQELDKRGVLFFGNVRGRFNLDDSPVSKDLLNGRVELDFLVFHQGKCLILEIDGVHHKKQVERDYSRDRVLLKQGMHGKDCRCRYQVYGYFY